jgi:DNA processing protein
MSRGCHEQLREGYARLVTSAQDVIAELGPIEARQPALGAVTARDALTRGARVVLDGFPSDSSASPADLSFATGVPIAQVAGELDGLLAAGMIELTSGGFRLTRQAREDRPGGVVA